MATAGPVLLTCPLCQGGIDVPVELAVTPARTPNGRAIVTVKARPIRHRCRRR